MPRLLLLAPLLLAACVNHSPIACPTGAPGRTARVFFATDRKQADPKPASAGSLEFTGQRTSPPALQMGWQQVALGPKHRTGLLDSAVAIAPAQIQSKASAGTPRGQTLFRSDAEIAAYVQTTLRSALRASKASPGIRKQVLLFVHGYNSNFDYSVRKAGQLAADLHFVGCNGEALGLPVTYSWPSQASLVGYLADEESAEWTQQRLVPFLQALSNVAREEGADLHIIAHSMGCRLLVRSLAQIALTRAGSKGGPLARQVILLAPDISRALFDQYFQRFVASIEHLTIYVSSKDRALALSSILHGGNQRLGLLESTIRTALQLSGISSDDRRDLGYSAAAAGSSGKIDMIDVTGGLTDFIGHSYEDPEFIGDVQELIYHHTPAGTGSRNYLEARQVRPDLFGLFGERLNYFHLRTK